MMDEGGRRVGSFQVLLRSDVALWVCTLLFFEGKVDMRGNRLLLLPWW